MSSIDHADNASVAFFTEREAESIDTIERTLINLSYPTMRMALSEHLTEISKKKLKRMKD